MFVLHRSGADVAEARVEDYNLRYRLRENDPIYLDFKKENPNFKGNNEVMSVKGGYLILI